MRSTAFKDSLINRIIVISRKPHGTAYKRLRVEKSSVLPVASVEVLNDAVDYMLCRSWPQRCVRHAVSSLAASQCRHLLSQHQLARLYQTVSEWSSSGEEGNVLESVDRCGHLKESVGVEGGREDVGVNGGRGDVGEWGGRGSVGVKGGRGDVGEWGGKGSVGVRGDVGEWGGRGSVGVKGGREDVGEWGGKGSVGVKGGREDVGVNGGRGDEGEWGKDGMIVGTREACLSALIPLLARHSSLHHKAHNALCQVLTAGGGLSPKNEQSLLLSCADNHRKLVSLAASARTHGHRFSRSFYRGALSMVLQQQSTPGQQEGEEGRDGVSPVAAELVAMMSGDWEKSVLEADMFWVALHLASGESQVQAICDEMCISEQMSDESVLEELVRACLRTARKLKHPNPRHSQADPSQAVSVLVSRLPARQPSVSAAVFERVFTACADTLQMKMAYDTFMCMTHTHGLAPTRAGLQGLARLLCSPVFAGNPRWRKFRLAFASHMLEASVDAFGGAAPGWVYAECARPFTELLGMQGYHLTYNLCEAAVNREHGDDATVVMNGLWGRGLYHALLQSCRINHGPQLATSLLQHMTSRGVVPNERTFRHLLKFSPSQADIDDYMAVLARHMNGLSSEELAKLDQPLHSMLLSVLPPGPMDSEVVDSTVMQLLTAVSGVSTEQSCISHLASLSGLQQMTGPAYSDTDTACEHTQSSSNRATA